MRRALTHFCAEVQRYLHHKNLTKAEVPEAGRFNGASKKRLLRTGTVQNCLAGDERRSLRGGCQKFGEENETRFSQAALPFSRNASCTTSMCWEPAWPSGWGPFTCWFRPSCPTWCSQNFIAKTSSGPAWSCSCGAVPASWAVSFAWAVTL